MSVKAYFFLLLNIFNIFTGTLYNSVNIMKLLLFNLNANIRIIGKLLGLPGDTIMSRSWLQNFKILGYQYIVKVLFDYSSSKRYLDTSSPTVL